VLARRKVVSARSSAGARVSCVSTQCCSVASELNRKCGSIVRLQQAQVGLGELARGGVALLGELRLLQRLLQVLAPRARGDPHHRQQQQAGDQLERRRAPHGVEHRGQPVLVLAGMLGA
jgi:hypothetical protein